MAPAASRLAPAARRRRSDVSRTIAYAVSSAPERAQDSGKRRGIIDPASISLAPASGIADSRRGERCSRRRDGEGPANRRGDRRMEQSAIARTRFSTEGQSSHAGWEGWRGVFAPLFDIREENPPDRFRAEIDEIGRAPVREWGCESW